MQIKDIKLRPRNQWHSIQVRVLVEEMTPTREARLLWLVIPATAIRSQVIRERTVHRVRSAWSPAFGRLASAGELQEIFDAVEAFLINKIEEVE